MVLKKLIGGGRRGKNKLLFLLGRSEQAAPHKYKGHTVKKYARKYKCDIFLETGTYHGDMDLCVYDYFKYLASVEIQKFLYEENKDKFKGYQKLHLYNGDSMKLMPVMLEDIKKRCKGGKPRILFWLDGHYSKGETGRGEKDTPIMEELQAIKNCGIGNCVILIDDARCFTHAGEFIDYPTISYLKKYVEKLFPNCRFCVRNDIIRVVFTVR